MNLNIFGKKDKGNEKDNFLEGILSIDDNSVEKETIKNEVDENNNSIFISDIKVSDNVVKNNDIDLDDLFQEDIPNKTSEINIEKEIIEEKELDNNLFKENDIILDLKEDIIDNDINKVIEEKTSIINDFDTSNGNNIELDNNIFEKEVIEEKKEKKSIFSGITDKLNLNTKNIKEDNKLNTEDIKSDNVSNEIILDEIVVENTENVEKKKSKWDFSNIINDVKGKITNSNGKNEEIPVNTSNGDINLELNEKNNDGGGKYFNKLKKDINQTSLPKIKLTFESFNENKGKVISFTILILTLLFLIVGNYGLKDQIDKEYKTYETNLEEIRNLTYNQSIQEIVGNYETLKQYDTGRKSLTMFEIYTFLGRIIPEGNLINQVSIKRENNEITYKVSNIKSTFDVEKTLKDLTNDKYILGYKFGKVDGKTKDNINYTYEMKLSYSHDDNIRRFLKDKIIEKDALLKEFYLNIDEYKTHIVHDKVDELKK